MDRDVPGEPGGLTSAGESPREDACPGASFAPGRSGRSGSTAPRAVEPAAGWRPKLLADGRGGESPVADEADPGRQGKGRSRTAEGAGKVAETAQMWFRGRDTPGPDVALGVAVLILPAVTAAVDAVGHPTR